MIPIDAEDSNLKFDVILVQFAGFDLDSKF